MQKKDNAVKAILANLVTANKITGYAYDHFRQSEVVPTPFALYRRVAADNFGADGVVYHRGDNVDLELYADTPEDMAELMDTVETMLSKRLLRGEVLPGQTVTVDSRDGELIFQ